MLSSHVFKRTLIPLVLAVFLLSVPGPAFADRADSWFQQARIDLSWMNATAQTLSAVLEEARRNRDVRKINCIESRLVEIQEIVAESEGFWAELGEGAARQDYDVVEEKASRIAVNRERVEELMELVDNCQSRINTPGGFTEVTEVSEDIEAAGDEDMQGDESEGQPEPLPPDFEPPEEPSPSSN